MSIKKYLIAFLSLFLMINSSCTKENVDLTTSNEEEIPVTVIQCEDFGVELSETGNVISTEVMDGTAPYTFLWSTGATTSSISVTENGTYAITVTDMIGCETTQEITVELSPNDCDGFAFELTNSNGIISVEVIGGTSPYSYNWSNEETSASITVLENGTYSITLVDAENCTFINEIDVNVTLDCEDLPLTIAQNSIGEYIAEANGGTPPYEYIWSNGITANTILIIEEGSYTVTISDANGCTGVEGIYVNFNPDCDAMLNVSAGTNPMIEFSEYSEAYLFKEGCPDLVAIFTPYDHFYVIVDVAWEVWGTNIDPSFSDVLNGNGVDSPGIVIGSNGMPQVGDVIIPFMVGDEYFYDETGGVNYNFNDMEVTITEISNEVDGIISGLITGTIVDENDPDNSASVSGEFCVTIVYVCG